MHRGLRRIDLHPQRRLLTSGWRVCTTPAEADNASPPRDDAQWREAPRLGSLAAILRERNEWSLDAPVNTRRFDADDAWYRLDFDLTADELALGPLILGFDGLAGIATAWLNDAFLLSSDNMFLAQEHDVSATVRAGHNTLLIRFQSLDRHLAKRRPRPRWKVPMVENQQLRWVRTTLLGRTPGWSPPAAVTGPWKDIWLEPRTAWVELLKLDTHLDGDTGRVDVDLSLHLPAHELLASATLELLRNGQRFEQPLTLDAAGQRLSGAMHIASVAHWWPHTHGEPALYSARVLLQRAASAPPVTVELGRIGFRTVAVDTTDGDFAVRVNDHPVFCRGACWTPLDVVTLRASPEEQQAAIAQARAAGMNMLRVTGTMVYEDEAFLNACDEAGMLVWQDFMFANMDYPEADAAFMASVEAEARQELRRWNTHPCITVLCGNSEVEQQAAMWGASRELWQPALFHRHLRDWCADLLPGVPYWPSSAHGGDFPYQGNVGTTSYYGVGAYLRPLDDARRSQIRFATECLAFANVPEAASLEHLPSGLATRVHHPHWKARTPRDLGAGWDFDDVRDHYLATLFEHDPNKLRYADHERYLTLSRLASGEAMQQAFTEWRRPGSSCRGALVLFLRDLWPSAGWGLIDDRGVPKACYHQLKRALQPLNVGLTEEGGNGIAVHLHNECGTPSQVELTLTSWRHGEVQVARAQQALELPARSSQTLNAMALFEHFSDFSYAYRFGPRQHDVIAATLHTSDGKFLAEAFHFASPMGDPRVTSLGLEAIAQLRPDGNVDVVVSAQRLAQAVHFDVPGFTADDEHFHLLPGAQRRVVLRKHDDRTGRPQGSVHAINALSPVRLMFPPGVSG